MHTARASTPPGSNCNVLRLEGEPGGRICLAPSWVNPQSTEQVALASCTSSLRDPHLPLFSRSPLEARLERIIDSWSNSLDDPGTQVSGAVLS